MPTAVHALEVDASLSQPGANNFAINGIGISWVSLFSFTSLFCWLLRLRCLLANLALKFLVALDQLVDILVLASKKLFLALNLNIAFRSLLLVWRHCGRWFGLYG